MVFNDKGVESSSFFLDFLWYITYHILIPIGQSNCTPLEVWCYPFRSGRESAWAPSLFNDFTAIFPFDLHGFKLEATFTLVGWWRGICGCEDAVVWSWFDQVMHFGIFKVLQPLWSSKSSVQMRRYFAIPFLHVAPSEIRTIVPQVLKTTRIHNMTEAIHLALRALGSSCFFMYIQNFIKIATTKPRQIKLITKKRKEFPWFFLKVGLQVPIGSGESPWETIA